MEILVRAGQQQYAFIIDGNTVTNAGPFTAGMRLRIKYKDLEPGMAGGAPVGTAVEIIDPLKPLPAPKTPRSTSATVEPNISSMPTHGFYFQLGRCRACYYDHWQRAICAALTRNGLPAFPGSLQWDARTNTLTRVSRLSFARVEDSVLIGPFPSEQAVKGALGRLSSVLQNANRALGEPGTLQGGVGGYMIGRFEILVLPAPRRSPNQFGSTGGTNIASVDTLVAAISRNDIAQVRGLLRSGVKLNSIGMNGIGNTPLFAAARDCNEEMVRLLLDNGADPNFRGSGGSTALMGAVSAGRIPNVRVLLSRGADPNARGYYGATPLGIAESQDEPLKSNLVRILRAAGAR